MHRVRREGTCAERVDMPNVARQRKSADKASRGDRRFAAIHAAVERASCLLAPARTKPALEIGRKGRGAASNAYGLSALNQTSMALARADIAIARLKRLIFCIDMAVQEFTRSARNERAK